MEQERWPLNGGDTGALLRSWTGQETPLGPSSEWPVCLKSVLQLILLAPTPMAVLWGRDGLLFYNDGYAAIAADRHPRIMGEGVLSAWPEQTAFNREALSRVLQGEALSYEALPFALYRDGAPQDVWLDLDYSPILDHTGRPAGVLALIIDVTAAVRALQDRTEAETALRAREQELAQVQKIGRIGGLEVDFSDGFRNRRSPEYLAIHGLPPDAVHESHQSWVDRIHPDDRIGVERAFRDAVKGEAVTYQAEYRIIRPSDGAVRWIAAMAEIARDPRGRALRLTGAHLDVTQRKETEAQLRLLMQELSHRVKNSLAMVQAIASQTFRAAQSLDDARESFTARLSALSRAHDLLVSGNWAQAKLADVVASIVGIQGEPDRFVVSGPDLVVGPKAALALNLILHELATNAVKYGALSGRSGQVAIAWRVDDMEGERQFRLRWQESGGPQVAPPTRRGFGSRLIERTFPSARARVENAFVPAGLVFTLDAPLEDLQQAGDDQH